MEFLLSELLPIDFWLFSMKRLLTDLEKARFSILDDIRETTAKQSKALTLSIGVGTGSTSLIELGRTCTVESGPSPWAWWRSSGH